jgi:FkbM family methyltransferase
VGELLNRIYASVSNPGLIPYIQSRDLNTEYVIEAGCHDGSDTIKFLSDKRFKKIFAFEPDPVAFNLATKNLSGYLDRVVLKQLVLMDKSGQVLAHPLHGEFGSGSTIYTPVAASSKSKGTINPIGVSRLDDEIPNQGGNGALWLDVEGAALLVLQGASRVLKQIIVAQIEIDMHIQSGHRLSNYRGIIRLMKAQGFNLVAAPIHPGYFGDALFVKLEFQSNPERVKSFFLQFTFIALHSILYPLIGRIKNRNLLS